MMNLKNSNYKMNCYIVEIINIKKKFLHIRNQSLLFSLEFNDINIEYQCRSGYCGMCRVQLIKGNILYSIKQPIAALFKDKDIFPCCCEPNGNIAIKI